MTDIESDAEGFLWFGTENGFFRFDGYEFVRVGDDSLRDPHIVALDADGSGNVWIGTRRGGVYRYVSSVRSVEAVIIGSEIRDEVLTDLVMGRDNVLRMATEVGGLIFFDSSTSAVSRVIYDPLGTNSLAAARVKSIAVDSTGHTIAVHERSGISIVDADGRVVDTPIPPPSFSADPRSILDVHDAAIVSSSELLLATSGGLVGFDRSDGRWTRHTTTPARLVYQTPRDLWVYQPSGGIVRLEPETYEEESALAITSRLNAIHVDHSGAIWAATASAGPLYHVSRWSAFTRRDVPSNLCCLRVTRLSKHNDRSVLVGTESNGVLLLDTDSGELSPWYTPRDARMAPSPIDSLASDGRHVAVGLRSSGAHLLEATTDGPIVTGRFDSDVVAVAVESATFYLGTSRSGVIVVRAGIDPQTVTPTRTNGEITALGAAHGGGVWLGTSQPRISRLDWTGRIEAINHPFRPGPGVAVSSIQQTVNGMVLAVDTRGRIGLIDPELSRTLWLVEPRDLGIDPPLGAVMDESGDVWVLSSSGLFRYRPAAADRQLFTLLDGLFTGRPAPPAIAVDPNGSVVIGTDEGLLVLDSNAIEQNAFVPRLVVTSVQAPGAVSLEWNPESGDGQVDTVVLPASAPELRVQVSGLDFSAPDRTTYSYRRSTDVTWSAPSSQREIVLRDFVPDDFELLVRATNSDGITSAAEIVLMVDVRPYFWQTPVFVILAAVAIIGVAWIAVRTGISRAEEQRQALQASVRRRTAALEASKHALEQEVETRREVEVALHEIQADLEQRVAERTSALRGANDQLAKEVRERREAQETTADALAQNKALLQEIHHRVKNNMQVISSLLSLQSHLVADSEARAGFQASRQRIGAMALIHDRLYHSDNFAEVNMGDYFASLAASLRGLHGRSIAVQTHVRSSPLVLSTATPCGLITNELVTNAMKHAFSAPPPPGAEVLIEFLEEEDGYTLSVADNGKGFSGVEDGGAYEASSSLGMKIVEVLVSQIDGTMDVRLNERTRFGRGTECVIRF